MPIKKRPLILLSLLGGVSLWACSTPSVQSPATQPSASQSPAVQAPASQSPVNQASPGSDLNNPVSNVPPTPTNPNIVTQDPAISPPSATSDARDLTVGTFRLKAPVRRRLKNPVIEPEDAIEIPSFEFSAGYDLDKDGGENRNIASKVKVEGFGEHELFVNVEDFPVMDNREDMIVVTDKANKNSTMFQSDQDLFNYTIKQTSSGFTTQQATGELRIETQPDGSWLINGEAAATPEAAAQILIKHPVIKNTSIHTIGLLLFSAKDAIKDKLPGTEQVEYVDLPYADIDKMLLTDIGDLVNEKQLATFLNQEFFKNKDLDSQTSDTFFSHQTDFGELSEAVPYEGEFLYKDNQGFDESELIINDVFEHEQQLLQLKNANKSPIWGDLTAPTLTSVSCRMTEKVSTDYGNPVPLLQALFDLMKAERGTK